jgi:hypothetical protein
MTTLIGMWIAFLLIAAFASWRVFAARRRKDEKKGPSPKNQGLP